VHKAINHLMYAYAKPGTVADPLANFNMNVSPVTYNGQPVVLSTIPGVASNYPVAAVTAAFAAAAAGNLAIGPSTATYRASATLVSMRQIVSYGTSAITVVQTWNVTGVGAIAGVLSSTVEVSSLMEQQIVPAHTYAAFATNPGCGALSFSGGILTNSYDSSNMTMVNGKPATDALGGDVGTNGNLTESGGSIVNGTLSTPRAGVGNCKNGAVTGLTANGGATVTGGMVPLPQAIAYTVPDPPNPLPPVTGITINNSATCASIGLVAPKCAGAANVFTFTPGGAPISLGNISMTGGTTVHLTAGVYNINSLAMSGGSHLIVDSGPIILNIVGAGQSSPLDLTGGTTSNLTYDPSNLQILYGGTGTIKLAGGTGSAATVYAPNAAAQLSGGADFYGSILGATLSVTGGTQIHYDRHLGMSFFTVGQYMLNSFTWKKF
jgi:hypothetical protein